MRKHRTKREVVSEEKALFRSKKKALDATLAALEGLRDDCERETVLNSVVEFYGLGKRTS